MPRDAGAHLASMMAAVEYLLDQAKRFSLDQYLADETLRFAFRYNLTVIGESMSQLRTHHPGVYPHFKDANEIVGFRNFVVHAYWNVDDKEVWSIVIKDLPALRAELARILNQP
jgi:uncharacterized protein with HEPN domain